MAAWSFVNHRRARSRGFAALRLIVAVAALFAAHAAPALAEKRVALVAGIDRYTNLEPHAQLERAVNDAAAMAKALAGLGFEVTKLENASRSKFNEEWQQFLAKTGPGDTVAFFFSGHGIEIGGSNYLIPGDMPRIQYGREQQIKRESLAVSELLLDLHERKPGVAVLILDACRDHPLIPPEYRAAGTAPGGLAKMDAPEGTFIMYSAGAGQTALDRLPGGDSDRLNSVYTRNLLPLLTQKGLKLQELAIEVRERVHGLAGTVGHRQTPAYYDGVLGKFCLAGCEAGREEAAPGGGNVVAKKSGSLQGGAASVPAMAEPPEREAARAWNEVKDSRDAGLVEAFRAQFGRENPFYGWLAEGRLAVLKAERPAHSGGSKAETPRPAEAQTAASVPTGASVPTSRPVPDAACDGLLVAVAAGDRPCIKPGSGAVFKDCADCPEMVIVPAGRFTMGSPENEPEHQTGETQHEVRFAKPFAAGRFAVTFAQWDACVADGGCGGYRPSDRDWGRDDRPVINVNWDDAKSYVQWLSKKTGRQYRLLSEAEREYVTRAGTATPFWWGSSISTGQANYDGNYTYNGGSKGEYRQKTLPVNSFKPNPWGLYQVHGNVREWVEDCYHDSYSGAPSDGTAWTTGECKYRVLRGGSWDYNPQDLRAAFRLLSTPDYRNYIFGFRVGLGWQDLNR